MSLLDSLLEYSHIACKNNNSGLFAMNEFEERKSEVLEPIYFEAGAALFDCQTFEQDIAFMLYLFAQFGLEGFNVNHLQAILDNKEKKTAGQLIRLLKTHITIREDLEETLSNSLEARNILIHRFLIENVERFLDSNEREKLIKEIRSLRSRVRKSHKKLDPVIKAMAELLTGVSLDDISNEVKAKLISYNDQDPNP